MLVGYARISTITQNEDRQIEALRNAGCEKIYLDKMSGKMQLGGGDVKLPVCYYLFSNFIISSNISPDMSSGLNTSILSCM